jgi:rhamnosyltransferase subunit B
MGFPLYDCSTQPAANREEEKTLLCNALYGAEQNSNQSDKSPILFTMGSFSVHEHDFFTKASAVCWALQRRGVFLLGRDRAVPRSLPPHMAYLDRYIPLSRLLPQVAAVVHHGGIGTASIAFAAGVPQVITPLAHDHFDNARRIVSLGVGRETKAKNMSVNALTKALDDLLNSASVQTSCNRIKSLMQDNQSLERTCDVLEELAHKAVRNPAEVDRV